jgi:sugar phosphate isomerase/epimerase
MRISTEINSIAKIIGAERAIESLGKVGFDAWDFSMFQMCQRDRATNTVIPTDHPLSSANYLAYARKLKQIGLDNGIICNQSHAPFPTSAIGIMPYLKRAIECTAEAGGKICIIHPANNKSAEENAEMYFELLPFAKECGVKIATENMWNWNKETDESCFAACATSESFLAHINAVNDDFLIACLDIGHAEMRPSGSGMVPMIHALGKHLQALHIHDNDLKHDDHALPFTMSIDFVAMIQALKEINYQGDLTLEADHVSRYDAANVQIGITELYEVAKRLKEMFEA